MALNFKQRTKSHFAVLLQTFWRSLHNFPACRFAEFDFCHFHVFVLRVGSFLMQDIVFNISSAGIKFEILCEHTSCPPLYSTRLRELYAPCYQTCMVKCDWWIRADVTESIYRSGSQNISAFHFELSVETKNSFKKGEFEKAERKWREGKSSCKVNGFELEITKNSR